MSKKNAYREFCLTAADLPLFMQDWYLDAVCLDGTWEVAIVEEKGKIVASMPYFLKQKMGFRYSTIPLHVKHLGPYLIPEKRNLKSEHLLYAALIEQLPKTAHFIQDFAPMVTNWLPFFWKGYQQTVRYTYILELIDLEKVYQNFNKSIKRNIKKAEKTVRIDHEISLEDYYQVNKMSFDRQGIPIFYSLDSLQRLDRVLKEKKNREIFVARDEEGNIHGVCYLIWDQTRSYFHIGGINPDFRNSGAYILLTWAAIRYTKEVLQLPIFDFAGSMLESVEPLRRQFGAKQVAYFRVWKEESSLFKLLSKILNVVKELF